jgi:hypothetical protein
MVWFFERAEVVTRLETVFDNATRDYVPLIAAPGDAVRTERFPTEQAYRARLVELEQHLKAQGWVQSTNIEITDGWRGPSTQRH